MSTLATLETRVRYPLGEATPSFWTSAEIQSILVDSLRAVQNEITPNATPNLVYLWTTTVAGNHNRITVATSTFKKVLSFVSEESDGEYGYPWTEVSMDVLERVRRNVDTPDVTTDYTSERLYAINGSNDPSTEVFYVELFPALPSGSETIKAKMLMRFTESGTLNIPSALEELVINRTVGIAASKKSRDLDTADRFLKLYKDGVEQVNKWYGDGAMHPEQTITEMYLWQA